MDPLFHARSDVDCQINPNSNYSGNFLFPASFILISIFLLCLLLPERYFEPLGFYPGGLGAIDLIQYWSGGALLLKGFSPYDSALVVQEQLSVFPSAPEIIQMWNPPPVVLFTLPMGLVQFANLIPLWFFIQISIYLLSVGALYKLFPRLGSGKLRWLFYFVIIFFYPLVSSLGYGQISFLLLGSLAAWLYFREQAESTRPSFCAGLLLSISIIKPHLFVFIYFEVVRAAIFRKRFAELFGLFVGLSVFLAMPLVIRPNIYTEYFAAWNAPPLFWKTPTLGSWVQWLAVSVENISPISREATLFRMLPMLIGVGAYLLWILPNKKAPSVYALIPLGVLVSPYGWIYDFMILLPSLAFILNEALTRLKQGDTKTIGIVLAIFLQSQVLFFLLPGAIGQESFVWYPAVIAALAIYVARPIIISDFESLEPQSRELDPS